MPASTSAGAAATASVRSRTSVTSTLLDVPRLRPVDDLAHQEHEPLEVRIAQRSQCVERNGLPCLIESVEHLEAELCRNDVNDAAVLRVTAPLGKPEPDDAVDQRARRAERALLHARDLVHGRARRGLGGGPKLLEGADLMPGHGAELALQLLGNAGHEPALEATDVPEEQIGKLIATTAGVVVPGLAGALGGRCLAQAMPRKCSMDE